MIFHDLALNLPQSYLAHYEDFFYCEDFMSLLVEKIFAIMETNGI
jgi:hypothetical protein